MRKTTLATFVSLAIASMATCCMGSAQAAFPIEGSSASALTRKGYDLVQTGSFDAATEVLKHAVRLNPNDLSARRYLVFALTQNGNFSDATNQLKAIAKVMPPTAVDYYLSGNNEKQQGNTDTALKEYRAALTVDPEMAAAKAGIIELFILASDFQGATFLCKDCLTHAKSDTERKYFAQLLTMVKDKEKADIAMNQTDPSSVQTSAIQSSTVPAVAQPVVPGGAATALRPKFPSIMQAAPLPPPPKPSPVATRAKA